MKKYDRNVLDTVIANGFSNKSFQKDYVFYMHILAQCRIILTEEVDIAAVSFTITKYNLFINPINFDLLPLVEQLGVIKHEMLHIIMNHIDRKEGRIHTLFNLVADATINQMINRDHLPSGAIYPDYLQEMLAEEGVNINVPDNLSVEQYYDLFEDVITKKTEEAKSKKGKGEHSEGSDDGEFYNGLWDDNPLDNHEKWDESKGDSDLKTDITRRLLDNAISKSRGSVPAELSEMIEIWNKKPVVSWKKVLRNIASNKKAKRVQTIMRKSRRFPKRPEIKGYKKSRDFDIVVILDVSGSMSDDDIIMGLTEIKEVAKITSSKIKIIQVDTEVHEVSDFNPNEFNRSAYGGTEILPGALYITENRMECDCIIVISDAYIESLMYWNDAKNNNKIPNVPYIFLSTNHSFEGIEYLKKAREFSIYDT